MLFYFADDKNRVLLDACPELPQPEHNDYINASPLDVSSLTLTHWTNNILNLFYTGLFCTSEIHCHTRYMYLDSCSGTSELVTLPPPLPRAIDQHCDRLLAAGVAGANTHHCHGNQLEGGHACEV